MLFYAEGIGSREKMLSGGKQDALLHEAGGIADAGDVVAVSLNVEIVESMRRKTMPVSGGAGCSRSWCERRYGTDALSSTGDDGGLKHVARLSRVAHCRPKISALCFIFNIYKDVKVRTSVACVIRQQNW